MHPFDEMKSWIGFGPADEERLRALAPLVEPELGGMADLFYARVLSHPGAAAVLRDDAQVDRLKGTLQRWARELLSGPWDDAYFARRERIGVVHVEVGLPTRYMFTAMNVFREELCRVAMRSLVGEPRDEACRSICRVCDMDLAIMVGTFVEHREAKEVETLQDLIVSHMPVTVLLIDADGLVTAATRSHVRLFGDVPVVGHPWSDAFPPALVRAARLDAEMARALETGREIALTRVDVPLDGHDRNFRIAIVPLDHPRARVLVHMEELTETIRTEGRLVRSESLAQLGALSAAVAHELRNPLAGISGAIQVITRSLPDTDRRKPIMDKVEQQVRRLDALVTDLLDFARPAEARVVDVVLEDIVAAVVDNVKRDHPGMTITAIGTGTARADPNLVHQVLLNLVLNAIQAVDGVGEVRIEVQPGRVAVSDSGPGIPPENVEKVFAPFFTTRTRGTGLGLAICRKAASAMGGQLVLTTGTLAGAAFALELP